MLGVYSDRREACTPCREKNIGRHQQIPYSFQKERQNRRYTDLSRDGRYIRLKFFNDSTVYTCGPDKAAVFADPEELPPDEYVFLSRGYRYADPARVQKFSEHWRIFRKNGTPS